MTWPWPPQQLAELEGVTGEALMLLRTAAYYHDIGYIEKDTGHEAVSMRIVAEVLPGFGFSPEQIQTISAMIQATVTPQSPHTLLEQILADADLDALGRHDFWEKNQRLRAELAAQGGSSATKSGIRSNWPSCESHRYFTPSARMRRNAAKQRHMAELADIPRAIPGAPHRGAGARTRDQPKRSQSSGRWDSSPAHPITSWVMWRISCR